MVRTQIQLTETQARALKELAAREGRSMAALIRSGVDELLRRSSFLSLEEQRRRAIAAAGSFRSDVDDLASRHDDYLAEAFGD